MKIALIYPPATDPTAPYISVPLLTGCLRAKGMDVVPVDANVEAWDRLLNKDSLLTFRSRLERRIRNLRQKKVLKHTDQLAWIALQEARAGAAATGDAIDEAVAVMRDRSGARFYDPVCYASALETIESALALISAACTPLELGFGGYRTPFSLLSPEEIAAGAGPGRDPFHDYFSELAGRLASLSPDVVGLSIAFINQVQPAYSLAMMLRRMLPATHLTAGGPAITQILTRLSGPERETVLHPFDTIVLFEGEKALTNLIAAIGRGETPAGIIAGETAGDLGTVPAPDFDGLPLDKYLSPEPVLPYDPTRGCYWGKCAFCHYGLTGSGTAPYRERSLQQVLDHVRSLSERHRCRIFYFSQDTILPQSARRLARLFAKAGAAWKWASDIRPEPSLTADCCRDLAAGGALAFSLGVESASARVLKLIDKGVRPSDMAAVISHLAGAGIAVEAMTFTGFPTETGGEALETVRFLERHYDQLALFICGEFSLVPGSRVARHPERFGLDAVWTAAGDAFIKTLFYSEKTTPLTEREADAVERAIARLSGAYRLHRYPWAGSLSTAHTLLWYNRFGPGVFRDLARTLPAGENRKQRQIKSLRKMADQAYENEAAIWRTLVYEKRAVSRRAYRALANRLPGWNL
ncbi:MAG: radical SAM protein [Thermodesulfobacteriota bacterium]